MGSLNAACGALYSERPTAVLSRVYAQKRCCEIVRFTVNILDVNTAITFLLLVFVVFSQGRVLMLHLYVFVEASLCCHSRCVTFSDFWCVPQ